MTWAAFLAGTSALVDALKIISSFEGGSFDLLGFAAAVVNFGWILLTRYVIPMINNIWQGLFMTGAAVSLFTPVGIVAKLVVMGIVAGLGIEGLRLQGCLPSI